MSSGNAMSKYKFSQCRAFGHAWKPTSVDHVIKSKDQAVYIQHLDCRVCGTEKSVAMNGRGELLGASYNYVEGYKLEGRNNKARNAMMRRSYLGI